MWFDLLTFSILITEFFFLSESPPAVQNLELKECDNATNSVILEWMSPDISSNDVPIESYNIMITPTPNVSAICSDGSCTVNATNTLVSISGLQYGVNHTIEIVPVNYCNQAGSLKVVHCKPMQGEQLYICNPSLSVEIITKHIIIAIFP